MRSVLLATGLALLSASCVAQLPALAPLTAEAIMARVGANQDSSEAERAHFLYVQHAHIASRKGKTIRCEETTDTRITPTASGFEHHLLKLDGRLLLKKHYVTYNELSQQETLKAQDPKDPTPGQHDSNVQVQKDETQKDDLHITIDDDDVMDRDLVENLRGNLTTKKSKDGIGANLFPLTTKEQADYSFTLLGREPRNGRDCFHIAFRPKDNDDFGWKGDAWIDATAFQPVVIRTAMARKVPFAVRALLGTNVPGLGFTVVYAPQTGGQTAAQTGSQPVWFPTSFGTEFKIRVLFFLNREIVFNAENREFQKTHVTSRILDAQDTKNEVVE